MKVHFAGCEQMDSVSFLNRLADIRYGLFTVFPFIAEKFGIKPMKLSTMIAEDVTNYLDDKYKHSIMDSGLFTLMFGAHAGPRDYNFCVKWQDAIVDFVKSTGYSGTVVEVDCQKILGVKTAWELRKKLKKQLPNNTQINVWHYEDGKQGLIEMAEFSDYIALSIPEFRSLGWKNLPLKVIQLCKIIKDVKPDIKIHLLGCTQKNIMRVAKFCYSCDSTSWKEVNRWGAGVIFDGGRYKKVKRSLIEHNSKKLAPLIKKCFKKDKVITNVPDDHYANYVLTAIYQKREYELNAGSQE